MEIGLSIFLGALVVLVLFAVGYDAYTGFRARREYNTLTKRQREIINLVGNNRIVLLKTMTTHYFCTEEEVKELEELGYLVFFEVVVTKHTEVFLSRQGKRLYRIHRETLAFEW